MNEAIASFPGVVHRIEADLGTSAGAVKLIEEAHCVIIFSWYDVFAAILSGTPFAVA